MALQFDGINDFAATAAALNLSGTNQITLSFWFYVPAWANDDDLLAEFSANYNNVNGTFIIDPNAAGGAFDCYIHGAGYNGGDFVRPSAAAWHHYIIQFDMSVAGNEVVLVAIDGSGVTVTQRQTHNNTGNFGTEILYLMSRAGASLFYNGRLAAWGIWNRLLNSTERSNLAGGALPTSITSGLVSSWRMDSAGNQTDGSGNGNTLNVTGATLVDDPPALGPPPDTTPPTFTSWATNAAGTIITGTASEELNPSLANPTDGLARKLLVEVNGSPVEITNVVVSAFSADLTISPPISQSTDVVTVTGSP